MELLQHIDRMEIARRYYFNSEGRSCGPFTEEEIQGFLESQSINDDTLLYEAGPASVGWKPVREYFSTDEKSKRGFRLSNIARKVAFAIVVLPVILFGLQFIRSRMVSPTSLPERENHAPAIVAVPLPPVASKVPVAEPLPTAHPMPTAIIPAPPAILKVPEQIVADKSLWPAQITLKLPIKTRMETEFGSGNATIPEGTIVPVRAVESQGVLVVVSGT